MKIISYCPADATGMPLFPALLKFVVPTCRVVMTEMLLTEYLSIMV